MPNINLIKKSLELVQKSVLYQTRGNIFEVKNAVTIFNNFSGRPNNFNNTSKYCNLVLNEQGLQLFQNLTLADGSPLKVKIHQYPSDDQLKVIKEQTGEDIPPLFYINIKVNMGGKYPPVVKLYSKKQVRDDEGKIVEVTPPQTTLTEETIGCLDQANIERMDIAFSVRESTALQAKKEHWSVQYLQKMNAKIVIIPDFGGDWDDVDTFDPSLEPNMND